MEFVDFIGNLERPGLLGLTSYARRGCAVGLPIHPTALLVMTCAMTVLFLGPSKVRDTSLSVLLAVPT